MLPYGKLKPYAERTVNPGDQDFVLRPCESVNVSSKTFAFSNLRVRPLTGRKRSAALISGRRIEADIAALRRTFRKMTRSIR
jgi:hypothetical protein